MSKGNENNGWTIFLNGALFCSSTMLSVSGLDHEKSRWIQVKEIKHVKKDILTPVWERGIPHAVGMFYLEGQDQCLEGRES